MNLTTVSPEKISPPIFYDEPQEIFYPETDGEPMAETDIHRKTVNRLIELLDAFFAARNDVYVSGNLLVYYEKGNPRKCFAPDVFVVKGAAKRNRRIYKMWEEHHTPTVVFEISSKATALNDLQTKFLLYQKIGVKEYYIFDPEYDYLHDNPFLAYRLRENEFVQLELTDKRILSEELKLEIVDTGETLRLFDPATNEFLLLPAEERARREESENLLQTAESEIERLKAELARLKSE